MAADISDSEIREMAEARVGFKSHAMAYVIVNLVLIAIWFFRPEESGGGFLGRGTYWPFWAHFGWGIGLAFHGYNVYGSGTDMVRREEQKLRQKLGRS